MHFMTQQSEMRAELDRFSREKKELTEQVQEIESQLEWLRSERDDEKVKLSAEKKVLQDRLHDADTQLSQLKSRKRDELKVLFEILILVAATFFKIKKLSYADVKCCAVFVTGLQAYMLADLLFRGSMLL